MRWLHQILVVMFVAHQIQGITFYLKPNSKRCIKEEVLKGVLVSGEYTLSDSPGHKTDLIVTDTNGHVLAHRENIHGDKGKFAFTTDTYDVFEVCFITKLPPGVQGQDREVQLNLKHGAEAINYDKIAEVEKLKPLEMKLQQLEDLSENIVKDFAHMRQREEEMRDTNESTSNRVLYSSILGMCCLLGLVGWQIIYLRRYFKSKKLID
ncbi:transmembrane emp24 domain-containing protein bai-like [Tropilaelaps mercedesae]|uniref:Transmembrane emp24 domain-containing protein bai-like n=1 Tax=Tropilaelaps mercedesae TaxID=418985 RepID=A0A1V9Y0W3_9ACAR|nr:transmembrane emp24 domain-containing protein bai-like [Tropilaelaps mercedesae]